MSYDLNTKAYNLFIQIEVGLREFLITCILEKSVHDWTKDFLGSVQRDTISEVLKRINHAYKSQMVPDLADQYIFKLDRAKKENSFFSQRLFHPFYYLNWTDLESLMRMKCNSSLIDNRIGRTNRETIVENLKPLNNLRNDIAHSRFITEENYKFLKASYDSISVLIPTFEEIVSNQTSERTIKSLMSDFTHFLDKIENIPVLSVEEIREGISILNECINSFWLNTENSNLVMIIVKLKEQLEKYKIKRESIGGLLDIQDIKSKLILDVKSIKTIIHG